MLQLPPLSLYIHIPWCVKKCPYCDFNSHNASNNLPEKQYIQALLDDLDNDMPWVQNREIKSIFIGGGTPSLFSASSYDYLFNQLTNKLSFAKDIEITLEANPGTFEAEKFNAYRQAGINRLSIGIQSFNEHHLKRLGRIHNGSQAQAAIKMAYDAGFERINLDLMHGLPEQTPQQALADLELALSFKTEHLSWYQLTIEPNTQFYKTPPILPDDERLWEIQEKGQALIQSSGLQQYEISGYTKAGCEAKHNLNYWQFGDYLGIGAGAHGKLSLPDGNRILRTQKRRMPNAYLNQSPFLAKQMAIPQSQRTLEFMLNALRLKQGVTFEVFENRTGLSLKKIQAAIKAAQSKKLLEEHETKIVPTEKGQLFLNDLLALFSD